MADEQDEYVTVDLDDTEITAVMDLAEVLAEQGSELWKGIFEKLYLILEGEE